MEDVTGLECEKIYNIFPVITMKNKGGLWGLLDSLFEPRLHFYLVLFLLLAMMLGTWAT
jgi:hypothetical protein